MTRPGLSLPVLVAETPLHMVWLTTNACNARCQHCSSNSAKRSRDELSTTEVLQMLDEFAEVGVVDLGISGGEPLLRKDLFVVIRHARSLGMTVGVGSNGTTVTESVARRLEQSEVNRFQLSLDGLEPSHDRLRCWPGMFQRVLRSVNLVLERGIRTHVCCTITRLNHTELESFTALMAGLGVHRINFSRYVPTGRLAGQLDLAMAEWRRVIELCVRLRDEYRGRLEIVTHLAQQVLVDPEVADMRSFVGCQAGRAQGCVTANGTVIPCVLLPIPLGNVRSAPFGEIWRNAGVVRELQARSGLKGACGCCPHRSRCGGCRAVAYARTGDYLATDERCWLAAASSPSFPNGAEFDTTVCTGVLPSQGVALTRDGGVMIA